MKFVKKLKMKGKMYKNIIRKSIFFFNSKIHLVFIFRIFLIITEDYHTAIMVLSKCCKGFLEVREEIRRLIESLRHVAIAERGANNNAASKY
jgi:hypothetical protein